MSASDDAAGTTHRIAGLHVVTHGAADAPALLLSAGLGGQGGYWAPHLDLLARDFRVILYDQRGTGKSERAIPMPCSMSDFAADMLAILDGLGIDAAHVMGHAAGGMAGLQLALDAPGRALSVCVINGWDAPDPHFIRCMQIRRDIMITQGAAAYLRAQPLFLFPAEWISANLAALDAQVEAHAAHFQTAETLFARMDALTGSDMTGVLGDVACPVLVIGAGDDMLVPASRSQALADALVGADVTLAISPDGGHAVNITRPDWFESELTAFLAKA